MFDDPRKELERMEKKLLAAEDDDWLENQLAEAKALIGESAAPKRKRSGTEEMVYRNYANGYGAGAPKKETVLYADEYEDEEEYPREKGVRGLIILACLETLGIVGVLAYWLVQFL